MSTPPGGVPPGAGPMAGGSSTPPSSPQGAQTTEDPVLQAQAKILAEVLRQLLPKQTTTPIGPQPICVKVLPSDTGRTAVVMVHDPVKDGLMFVTGQQAESDPTTAHTTIRLLQ